MARRFRKLGYGLTPKHVKRGQTNLPSAFECMHKNFWLVAQRHCHQTCLTVLFAKRDHRAEHCVRIRMGAKIESTLIQIDVQNGEPRVMSHYYLSNRLDCERSFLSLLLGIASAPEN